MFSSLVEEKVRSNALIEVVLGEVADIPAQGPVVVAAGPLCSPALSTCIEGRVGGQSLAFFDAAAPIVDASTLDRKKVFAQSRYDRGEGDDYLNCPMDRVAYEAFVDELVGAERVILRDFERHDPVSYTHLLADGGNDCDIRFVDELAQFVQPLEELGATPVGEGLSLIHI